MFFNLLFIIMNLREYLQPFSCLFFGFVILSNVVRAQSYESGYILPVGKDTVRGFILNSTDYELLSEISFRGRSVQQPEKFTTNDITGFGFDYGRTFSRLFLKDTGADDLAENRRQHFVFAGRKDFNFPAGSKFFKAKVVFESLHHIKKFNR